MFNISDGAVLIMSEVPVIIVSALRFLPNETMSALKWGGAFPVISAFFEVLSAATDKTTSKKGKTSSRT